MRSLDLAREACERYHPGLLKALAAVPYAERERPGGPVISLFRAHGGVGLLVPASFGGHGADAVRAVAVQRALGALSPSLAAGVTMHHFTAAMLYSLAGRGGRLSAAQLAVLRQVVPKRQLMASGWAEGRTQANILAPSVTARPVEGGFVLSGAKKPCSLSASMDWLTASVAVPGAGGDRELALALVPAGAKGMSVRPFWGSDLLAGAESDEVVLEEVFVPGELVVRTSAADPRRLDDLQTAGFVWFELLVAAGYTGAAGALVEAVVDGERGTAGERAGLAVRLEAALAVLEGAARAVREGLAGEAAVAAVLVARYAVQEALPVVAAQALELLGGLDFIRRPDHARMAGAVRALAFHPPSRAGAAEPLLRYFGGGPLELA
ncbi:acyl-CoA/acyl-ACP dehydrogenase [Streptomyces sp. HU2014]|uniref:acyl-CoA dehydrogenase family protein n=1 Tax=Streptomyces sp. HU2014 TaxID=2939414 RepID=UPI00200E90AC|nr:acyl-CoA dehydrogenase family protein [Streptomyces sp. HU2014]UQI45970.1 acyl-CoA/acyl-ACP dehydrogenase [Streptomyces sp. HU2014]UQI46078.1 acyl-CoA/acyl-ACP dehydrogenase [Streptomyces sp. HU2014]